MRLALNHAVDRFEMAKALGRDVPQAWHDPFPYAPERARQLLKQAGFGGGLDLVVASAHADLFESQAYGLVAEYLGAVGVVLEMRTLDWETWCRESGLGSEDGRTLYYGGDGLFLGSLRPDGGEDAEDPTRVRALLKDLTDIVACEGPAACVPLIMAPGPIWLSPGGAPPVHHSPTDRRRMRVWMWEDGAETLVCLVAWWPAFTTASRINYADSIDELIEDTLDDAVDEGACFRELEIMSHGNTGLIKMGDHDYIRIGDFDATGNPTGKTKDLLDALKRAMCPAGHLQFTACNQGNGDMLRKISAYLDNAITVSGFSGTGFPDGVPAGDVIDPDLHFQNGSTASGPP